MVSPQDPELSKLLTEFVPARVVNFKGVDLNRFQFDYDLTFAVLMMNADGVTYSRFGTQNADHSPELMSIAGLKQAMKDVLAVHRSGTTAAPPAKQAPLTIADIPAFARTKQASEACYHCHYANNARIDTLKLEGKFRKEMLFQYPHPENVGLTLDPDRNNVVKAVLPGSPAETAGLRAGDRIARANGARVITGADLQFALNPVPDPGSITLEVTRGEQKLPAAKLELPRGWRRTDISWRASQGGISPTMGFWGRPLTDEQKRPHGIAPDRLAIEANFMFPGPVWEKSRGGLQNGDLVVEVNGKSLPSMTMRQFHTYFRLNHEVGETVTVQVLRGGKKVDLRVPCIEAPEE